MSCHSAEHLFIGLFFFPGCLTSRQHAPEMGMEENQKNLKVGVQGLQKALVGSRGNAPSGGKGAKPPEAEGFVSKSKV